jgi:hypothetical protein
MQFLAILQQVADELGLPRPVSVTANDATTRQFAALANNIGQQLMKDVDWTGLQTEFIIEFGMPLVLTGDTVQGSRIVTNINTAPLLPRSNAFSVSGAGMQIACRGATIDSATQVTLTETADVTQIGNPLTFTRDTYDIPADFDRYIDQTMWDRRFQWAMIGPTSPQFDEWMRSGIVTVGPRQHWRQVGREPTVFRIFPPPSASGDSPGTLVWEYITNKWVLKQDGTFASSLTADTDVPTFPDGLLQKGIKYQFWAIKGFAYAELKAEYDDRLEIEKSRNGGKSTLRLNAQQPGYLISPSQIQNGSFPGPGNP